MSSVSTTLVTEAYNLAEGQSAESYQAALKALTDMAAHTPGLEVLVVDPSEDAVGRGLAAAAGCGVRYLHGPGLSYDGQKRLAVSHAQGEIVAFLDGDCRPATGHWLRALLAPFRYPQVEGVGGPTFYDDETILGKAMTILDFGYLFLKPGQIVGCYASNNVAFRRSTYLACPPPDSALRCNCFAHAQELIRQKRPLIFQPHALALHELPDIASERHRRGRDLVGVCWVDPMLPETAWLRDGERAAERFLAANVQLDEARLRGAPTALGVRPGDMDAVRAEMTRLRRLDMEGIREALAEGEKLGWNAEALARRRALLEHASPPVPLSKAPALS